MMFIPNITLVTTLVIRVTMITKQIDVTITETKSQNSKIVLLICSDLVVA